MLMRAPSRRLVLLLVVVTSFINFIGAKGSYNLEQSAYKNQRNLRRSGGYGSRSSSSSGSYGSGYGSGYASSFSSGVIVGSVMISYQT